VSAREVIEGDRHEPLRGERLAGMAADEPGTAGDKDTLAHIRLPEEVPRRWLINGRKQPKRTISSSFSIGLVAAILTSLPHSHA